MAASVAPYGGLMTKTLEEENAREMKLKEQAVSVVVNGVEQVVRPEALFIRGVDNLSTENIKNFIEYYVNYTTVTTSGPNNETQTNFEPLPIDQQLQFRVQWINDTSVNIVFKTQEEAVRALSKISITGSNPAIEKSDQEIAQEFSLENNVQERETKPYGASVQFAEKQDLMSRLGLSTKPEPTQDADERMELDDTANTGTIAAATAATATSVNNLAQDESNVVLYTRQSFQSDVKVVNAKAYSRYYLIHGEPRRNQHRKPRHKSGRTDRRPRRERSREDDEEDLFANKLRQRGQDRSRSPIRRSRSRSPMRGTRSRSPRDEEDLFAHKLK